MKCPDCGKEMDGKDICPQCGKKIEATAENIKVAYKEFPKSEFLEILAKPQKTGADSADASAKEDLEQQKEPSNSVELKSPAAQKKTKSAKSRAHKRKKDIDKQALFFFVAGLLAAFGIVGIYLLVKGFF
jgi:thiol:disulfide interchange protein